jgi:Ca-activated chloride channel family protein
LLQPLLAAAVVLLLTAGAEWLHARRVRRLARLAFGPAAAARAWTLAAPFLRVAALTAFAWGLAVMIQLHLVAEKGGKSEGKVSPRLVFVADLSPSMKLKDAGPDGKLTRQERIRESVEGVLMRVGGDLRYGVVGFYTDARAVVMEARDPELVRNVFNGLPVQLLMRGGKTDLGTAINHALKEVADLPEGSARLLIYSDGDTIPLQPISALPKSVKQVLVLGVGNPNKGLFIDGHQSRQDPESLNAIARSLGGTYYDINEKHLSTEALGDLVVKSPLPKSGLDLEQWAMLAMLLGSLCLTFVPVALQYFGTDWRAQDALEGVSR